MEILTTFTRETQEASSSVTVARMRRSRADRRISHLIHYIIIVIIIVIVIVINVNCYGMTIYHQCYSLHFSVPPYTTVMDKIINIEVHKTMTSK